MSTVANPIYPEGQGPNQQPQAANPQDAPPPDRSTALGPAIPALPYSSTVANPPGANTQDPNAPPPNAAQSAAQPAAAQAAQPGVIPASQGLVIPPSQALVAHQSGFAKALQIIAGITQAAPGVVQLLGATIVGVQHLMVGATGDAKRNAVLEIAGPVLVGIGAFAPRAGDAVAGMASGIEATVQGVFDLIKMLHPQALQVHPDNTTSAKPQ